MYIMSFVVVVVVCRHRNDSHYIAAIDPNKKKNNWTKTRLVCFYLFLTRILERKEKNGFQNQAPRIDQGLILLQKVLCLYFRSPKSPQNRTLNHISLTV